MYRYSVQTLFTVSAQTVGTRSTRPARCHAGRADSLRRVLSTISSTHRPATDLGFLLHKHPDRVQTFSLPFRPRMHR
jgi:RNA repair, ligase-Pnkp-associating, region of Hen1